MNARAALEKLLAAAVGAAAPARCVPPHLPAIPGGRTVVVAAGKAAAAMARAVEEHWPGPLEGFAVTRYGHTVPCRRLAVVEARHPVPDLAAQEAAARALSLAHGLGPDDLLLFLGSGGGSALLAAPAPGVTLADKQAVTEALLKSGADIGAINCVRKHLSAIKGGRLACAAAPARVVGLLISDVAGDDPAVIASGPTAADSTTCADARAILTRFGIAAPEAVVRRLADGAAETPKPGDPVFDRVRNVIVARSADALTAAARAAELDDIRAVLLGDALTGEARTLARAHAAEALRTAQETRGPCVLLSGGETTVTVAGPGKGGPNGEYLLALALALDGAPRIAALAADTDGIDGSETNAGAIIVPDTLTRARALGIDAEAALARNDSYAVFHALGDLIITGPTRTNVNDFRAILIAPRRPPRP